jgi:DNA (cytosine-5)-methyltransferase 1
LIPVVDIFAGPGGLSEGFNSLRDSHGAAIFESRAAIEMEASAVKTLVLRGAFRLLDRDGVVPDSYYDYLRGEITKDALLASPMMGEAYAQVAKETHQIELGPNNHELTDGIIARAIGGSDNWALIGGPPCQAYSLVGRSRRKHDLLFEDDKKHFLYREYLHTIRRFKPSVFVMENVKGLLSSTHDGTSMFDRILEDLRTADDGVEYDIYSLVHSTAPGDLGPKDFVIRAELYGVPQRRHRVILLGVRRDLGRVPSILKPWSRLNTVATAIGDMPPIRSVISRGGDSVENWLSVRLGAQRNLEDILAAESDSRSLAPDQGSKFIRLGQPMGPLSEESGRLNEWLSDVRLGGVPDHASRRHMTSDLERYHFAAGFALKEDRSPRLKDLPTNLLPAHKSATAEVAAFVDRFNVQVWNRPSSTIVSHMAKDGHYFIHPDPDQMRSLTVREAARLQTFPDNYAFEGNQTQKYVQVGNAVPPLLARQIGEIVRDLMSPLPTDSSEGELNMAVAQAEMVLAGMAFASSAPA